MFVIVLSIYTLCSITYIHTHTHTHAQTHTTYTHTYWIPNKHSVEWNILIYSCVLTNQDYFTEKKKKKKEYRWCVFNIYRMLKKRRNKKI